MIINKRKEISILQDIRFQKGFSYVMKNEEYFPEHPDDSSFITKFILTPQFLRSIGVEVSKNIDTNYAQKIFYKNLWIPSNCMSIENERIAIKYFDMIIQFGMSCAALIMNKVINELNDYKIEFDGYIGRKHLYNINKLASIDHGKQVLKTMCNMSIQKYEEIANLNESKRKYLKNWIQRANKLPEDIIEEK